MSELQKFKRFRIGGRVVAIRWVDMMPDPADEGEYSARTQTITVQRQGSHQREAEILFHEILHALIEISGVEFHGNEEEDLVTRLTPWVMAFFMQNPKLVKILSA